MLSVNLSGPITSKPSGSVGLIICSSARAGVKIPDEISNMVSKKTKISLSYI
jgi:hypothetical protein